MRLDPSPHSQCSASANRGASRQKANVPQGIGPTSSTAISTGPAPHRRGATEGWGGEGGRAGCLLGPSRSADCGTAQCDQDRPATQTSPRRGTPSCSRSVRTPKSSPRHDAALLTSQRPGGRMQAVPIRHPGRDTCRWRRRLLRAGIGPARHRAAPCPTRQSQHRCTMPAAARSRTARFGLLFEPPEPMLPRCCVLLIRGLWVRAPRGPPI